MAERVYCSEVAKDVGAQLAGTAVEVGMWLLIEYPRPWRPKALSDNDLDERINTHLEQLTQAANQAGIKLRIQFIKQGASTDRARPLVYLVDGRGAPRQLRGELSAYLDLLSLVIENLIEFTLPQALTPQISSESLLLVCTNGQRDLCCARFGLPLFETLRIEFDARVWQTTHMGGHRYAPNLLCLPSGLVYGFVDPDSCLELIAAHDEGQLDLSLLRGRSSFPPLVQAAEVFVRQHVLKGQQGGSLQLERLDDDQVGYEIEQNHVRLSGRVRLQTKALESVLASCGKPTKTDFEYELVEIISD